MTSALILLYQWNYPLFLTSLESYVAGGLGPRIIIIDNSEDGRVVNDVSVRPDSTWLEFPVTLLAMVSELNPGADSAVC